MQSTPLQIPENRESRIESEGGRRKEEGKRKVGLVGQGRCILCCVSPHGTRGMYFGMYFVMCISTVQYCSAGTRQHATAWVEGMCLPPTGRSP